MVLDLLTADQWTLWPPTAVTLATLSMAAAPGLVRVMEMIKCGVGLLQLVSVSRTDPLYILLLNVPIPTEITCSDLPTLIVSYDGGSTDIRPVDTGATYSCDTGYTINGDTSRICGVNRMWSGSTPTCRGKEYKLDVYDAWMVDRFCCPSHLS